MARCPFAQWNPVSFAGQLDHMAGAPKAVFLHTNGGGPHLTSWFDQLCDTESVIYAQFGASRWAVSIETEDDGDHHRPWTPKQLAAIKKLLTWLTDSGVGYHQQFSIYNQSGHDCPGPERVNQLMHTVLAGHAVHDGGGGENGQHGHGHVPQPLNPLPLPWMKKDPDTRSWQKQMLARGWSKIGTADSVYGKDTKAVCEAFQKEKGVPVTGKVDEHTWALAWTAPITH